MDLLYGSFQKFSKQPFFDTIKDGTFETSNRPFSRTPMDTSGSRRNFLIWMNDQEITDK